MNRNTKGYRADLRSVFHLAAQALTRLAIGGATFGQRGRSRAPECDTPVPIGALVRVAVYTTPSNSPYGP